MPQSSTMLRTLILLRGYSLSSFIKDVFMAVFVKFGTTDTSLNGKSQLTEVSYHSFPPSASLIRRSPAQ